MVQKEGAQKQILMTGYSRKIEAGSEYSYFYSLQHAENKNTRTQFLTEGSPANILKSYNVRGELDMTFA